MKKLGIIGAGTMGTDGATDALFHGFQVVLVDIRALLKKMVDASLLGKKAARAFIIIDSEEISNGENRHNAAGCFIGRV